MVKLILIIQLIGDEIKKIMKKQFKKFKWYKIDKQFI